MRSLTCSYIHRSLQQLSPLFVPWWVFSLSVKRGDGHPQQPDSASRSVLLHITNQPEVVGETVAQRSGASLTHTRGNARTPEWFRSSPSNQFAHVDIGIWHPVRSE